MPEPGAAGICRDLRGSGACRGRALPEPGPAACQGLPGTGLCRVPEPGACRGWDLREAGPAEPGACRDLPGSGPGACRGLDRDLPEPGPAGRGPPRAVSRPPVRAERTPFRAERCRELRSAPARPGSSFGPSPAPRPGVRPQRRGGIPRRRRGAPCRGLAASPRLSAGSRRGQLCVRAQRHALLGARIPAALRAGPFVVGWGLFWGGG